MIPFLHQFLCLVRHPFRGHPYVRVLDGNQTHLVCLCGARTQGWAFGESPVHTPGSQPYWDSVYAELVSVELELHGGG